MSGWREGRVTSLDAEWDGALECTVDVLDDATRTWTAVRALAYPALVGRPEVSDLVLLNTAALEAGLGTGGYAFVVAIPQRAATGVALGPGHVVKARYTPQQIMVLGVDEEASPHHELLRDADDLGGMPVVVADLHSHLPAVIAGIRADWPRAAPPPRVAYVMTDGASLPAWFSRAVAGLRNAGWINACITVGQAFGGDLEAVSLHTGLLAARLVVNADITVVTPGPGVVGTGTRWGFSGVATGEAVNATATLRGRPVATLRISAADARARHRGVSHHSLTALGRVALATADVVVPMLGVPGQDGEAWADVAVEVRAAAASLAPPYGRHTLVEVGLQGLRAALDDSPVRLSTMGRGVDADEPAFLAAAAAGRHAVAMLGA
ncbi:MAG: DUF3866 family protein [Kineosporiaceae bacterium]|nr:DUF3866 family protein [Kineosporiaceae bacterium]MBK7624837.1 DUF3866 family protein [Kineosporiaceae bacterium]MBK8076786.1 DUF3866 family protein [Kineosporiaceae bacterium]